MESIKRSTIIAFKKGKIKALEAIYNQYSGKVYNFTHSIIRNSEQAQDITQDVFLLIWEKRNQIDCDLNFDSYLLKIAQNMVYQTFRKNVVRENYINSLQIQELIVQSNSMEDNIDSDFLEEYIMSLVEALPKSRRDIFLLYWKSGLNYKEIATQLSISDKTVATQVRRSIFYLKEQIGNVALTILLLMLSQGYASNLL
ncbi:RNA polymerase, sigma-24 subunit, ECF subfamily [Bacteroides coprosuis DSM 18011]|uniref:RNA polymerase sigma factor n=1 Tax=Bacteroides coprosuis DSM 18011 TaxID=679937 RepID=F3ZRS5_9BACE|nr:RNA polymerase sigma-70 factor [Bacteroides coprosuis]EGJ72014.1 RNA polymerase, sigma-24 subunit, ECF subfamily [Bacteroides coprosuis DSM 18011]